MLNLKLDGGASIAGNADQVRTYLVRCYIAAIKYQEVKGCNRISSMKWEDGILTGSALRLLLTDGL